MCGIEKLSPYRVHCLTKAWKVEVVDLGAGVQGRE